MRSKGNITISLIASFIGNIVFLNIFFHIPQKIDAHKKDNSIANKESVVKINIRELGRSKGKQKKDIIPIKNLALPIMSTDLISSNLPTRKKQKIKNKKIDLSKKIKTTTHQGNFDSGQESQLSFNSGLELELKKGTSIDELNHHELVYYSFKNRTAKKYRQSILKNINKLKVKNPKIFDKFKNSTHTMKGKISYDKNGNVQSIKILEWSESNEVQDFFVSALKDIQDIPNPPKGILNKSGFKAIYKLNLLL